ncbi:enoyl-CoA hydratase/isomerase family protein [Paraglaciecola sp.]|uniref:enoyl-CoA hydratase/isomerase family protein n=1 Tax=Paraglaciecola sp. TaxID=1920173 RepID=UPI003266F2BD
MFTESTTVLFEELDTDNGVKIGHAKLTKVSALNALDLGMIESLYAQLSIWQQDQCIALILLDAEGDKAFCAGGDVVSMYHLMKQAQSHVVQTDCDEYILQRFFTLEYRLNHLIHTYSKPIIVWGNGIVMGGGLGLMCGASHRIVTASSRIAMPEISIGLYPDVGASYFLNKMPLGCGLFLGLTGAAINAADALYVNLADYFVSQDLKTEFVSCLLSATWETTSVDTTLNTLCDIFQTKNSDDLPLGHLESRQNWLNGLSQLRSVKEAVNYIQSIDPQQDSWFERSQKTLSRGSAISAHILYEQLRRGKTMTLSECLQMELGLSCKSGKFGEFQEGVRALLVDKDGKPNWKYKTVEEVPDSVVEYFFEAIWPADLHPLAHLT